ncbi:hypothetical protein [Shewanella marisflavi]|uniref:exodeoxyribonuclease X C-terminal domain-containing protein n=1 Tax=Shewanella marisflavi TaxID=260364 RepID=UPI003AAEB9F4
MPDRERSIESAMKYCENEARSKPAELILLNGKVVGPCELVLNFGKYAGRKVADVKEQDPRYLRYLYTSNLAARDFITMKLKYFLASWFGTVSTAAPG